VKCENPGYRTAIYRAVKMEVNKHKKYKLCPEVTSPLIYRCNRETLLFLQQKVLMRSYKSAQTAVHHVQSTIIEHTCNHSSALIVSV
jgi:hypothetical protein